MAFKFKGIKVSILILFVGLFGLFDAVMHSYAAGIFTTTGNLNYGRSGQSATLLPNGKVLIVGGNGSIPTAELYDAGIDTFLQTGNLIVPRQYGNTATLLPNGKVLIVGGIVAYHTSGEAELYDPATGIFTPTGSMAYGRVGHTATLLNNGKVLIAGGATDGIGSTRHTELYDPTTGIFTLTGDINYARYGHTATLLSNGKVLIVGGDNPDANNPDPGTNLEIYSPNTGDFSLAGKSLYPSVVGSTTTILLNGELLSVGGYNDSSSALSSAQIYDPVSGIFTATGSMIQGRWTNTATLLPNGNVLITGGYSDGGVHKLSSAEIYNTTTGIFSLTGSMSYARGHHTATLLPNNKVLVVGGGTLGAGDTLVAELYVDNASPVVGAITVFPNPVMVNTPIAVNSTFTDSNADDTHTVVWNWGDSATSTGIITENNGSGSISGNHVYTTAGIYTVSLTVTDNHDASGIANSSIVVYDPSSGSITGSGSFNSQVGAYVPNPTATGQLKFNIQAKYSGTNAVPTGKMNLDLKISNFSFDSTSLEWLVIDGNKVQLKGIGTVNGSGNYTIFVSMLDLSKKSKQDKIRIKITDSSNNVIYDNQIGNPEAADPTTTITKGSLKIHH